MCLFYGVSPVSLRRLVTEVRAVWQHHAEKLTGRVCHTLWLRALGEEVSAFQCGGQVWDVPAPGRQEVTDSKHLPKLMATRFLL
jgi:hypothetical protein